jgi:hypothetical protein
MSTAVPAGPLGEAPMSDELDLAQSVAGEEDPGASVDLTVAHTSPGKADQPPGRRCPDCDGSGQRASGICTTCQGTGKVTVGTSGA